MPFVPVPVPHSFTGVVIILTTVSTALTEIWMQGQRKGRVGGNQGIAQRLGISFKDLVGGSCSVQRLEAVTTACKSSTPQQTSGQILGISKSVGRAASDFPGCERAVPTIAAGWRGAGCGAWEARARGRAELTRPGSDRGGAGVRSGCASRTYRGALSGRRGGWRSPKGRKPRREVRAEPRPGGTGHRGPGLQAVSESPGARVGPWGRCPGAGCAAVAPYPRCGAASGRSCPRCVGGSGSGPGVAPGGPQARGLGPARLGRWRSSPLGLAREPLPTLHLAFLRSAVGVVPLCCREGARS